MKPTADQIDAARVPSSNGKSFCVFLRFENEAELTSAGDAYDERCSTATFGTGARLGSAPDSPCLLMFAALEDERERFVDDLLANWPDNGTLQTWEQAKPLWNAWGERCRR